jgi:hypothetical protein
MSNMKVLCEEKVMKLLQLSPEVTILIPDKQAQALRWEDIDTLSFSNARPWLVAMGR